MRNSARVIASAIVMGMLSIGGSAASAASSVGTISGEFSVSPGGTASYTIPITIPPGTAGLQPSLAIGYDSQNGDGTLGTGFGLSGLSTITRCNATLAQDGYVHAPDFSSSDRFCVDGSRLILYSGSYGGVGAEYRTEVDSFSKIVSYGGSNGDPAYFRVWTKSGLIMEYGATASSRIEAQGRSQARVWALDKVSDTAGNYYTVTYNTGGGNYYPSSILYTGNINQGTGGSNVVSFSYGGRPDPTYTYIGGSEVAQQERLTKITTYANGSPVRTYSMAYDQNGLLGRTRLTSITECSSVDGTCLPATTFSRQGVENVTQWQQPQWTGPGIGIAQNQQCLSGDLNGDGLTDMWCEAGSSSGSWAVYKSTGSGWQYSSWNGPKIAYPVSNQCLTGDMNGDGMTDMWCRNTSFSDVWFTAFSTGSGWQQSSVYGPAVTSTSVSDQCFTGDIDGDGRDDMWCETGTHTGSWTIAISTGPLWNLVTSAGPNPDTPIGRQCFSGDLNGDGRADMWCETGSASGSWIAATSTGTGWNDSTWNGPSPGVPVTDQCLTGDLNNDGNTDMWCETGAGTGVWATAISTGAGWVTSNWGNGSAPVYPVSAQCYTGDINGDGYTDSWCEKARGSGTYDVTLSNGTGWTHVEWYGPAPNFPLSNQCLTGDLNGDGQTDMWCSPLSGSTTWFLATSNSQLDPGLVTAITNGYSSKVQVDYKRLTDPSVYTKGYGATYPLQDFQPPFYVVSEERASDGIGGFKTTDYHYQGARQDLHGRGFLGYAEVTSTDQLKGIQTTTDYDQTFPFTGMAIDSQTSIIAGSDAGELISDTTNSLASQPLGSGYITRYFPYVQKAVTHHYEIGSTNPISSTNVVEKYYTEPVGSFYGDVTLETTRAYEGSDTGGGPQYWVQTNNTYEPADTTNWILGRLQSSVALHTNPDGTQAQRQSSFTYDPITGLLASEEIEPEDSSHYLLTQYQRDGFGNVIQKTVSGPDITTRSATDSFSADGRFDLHSCNALNQCANSTYDGATGNVLTVTDANGMVSHYTYDGFGRKTGVSVNQNGLNTSTSVARFWCSSTPSLCTDAAGGLFGIETTSSTGAQSVSVYNLNEAEVRQAHLSGDGSWVETLTAYDALGRKVNVSSPKFTGLGATYDTTYAYDAVGRPITVTAPLSANAPAGSVTHINYNGLSTTTINPRGNSSTKVFNALGKLMSSTDAQGNTVQYSYDPFGDLTSTTDSAGHTTTMTYDVRGHKTGMTDPDMGAWHYSYDALGELLSQTDAKGNTITMSYDKLGRMVSRTEAEDVTTWVYDTLRIGALTSVTVSPTSGHTASYSKTYAYTGFGAVQSIHSVIDGNPYTVSYSYDNQGRVTQTTYPDTVQVDDQYNSYGYLSLIYPPGGGASDFYWRADSWNQWGSTDQYTYGNGVQNAHYQDDAVGKISTILDKAGSGTIVQYFGYSWDANGNLTERLSGGGAFGSAQENFSYDNLDRLTTDQITNAGSANTTNTLTYDALGDITNKTGTGAYTYSSTHPHAVATSGLSSYTYDADGNLTSGALRSYTWSSYNKPLTLTNLGGDSSTFEYGPGRQKVRQVVAVPFVPTKTIDYVGNDLFERASSTSGTTDTDYISAPSGLVAMLVQSTTAATTLQYLHEDNLGSIDVITNNDGTVAQSVYFDAFGKRTILNPPLFGGSNFDSTLGYTGHLQLDTLSLVHMNGRVYDPVIGRFLSPDPTVQDPSDQQNLNRYSYVDNNPLTHTDPSGYGFFSSLFKIGTQIGLGPIGYHIFKNQVRHSHILRELYKAAADVASFYCTPYGAGFCAAAANASIDSVAGVSDDGALLKDAAIAGVTAEANIGIGHFLPISVVKGTNLPEFDGFFVSNVVAHGVLGGASSVVEGGKFGPGFFAGTFSAAAAPYVHTYTSGDLFLGSAASAVVGGTASVIGGGKFGNGAITGAFSYALDTCIRGNCSSELAANTLAMLNSLPNTIIGLGYGTLGYAVGLANYEFGGQKYLPGITFGYNAIEFTHDPLNVSAVTFGNTINYGPQNPGDPSPESPFHTTGQHEMQHTFQSEVLGPLYIPAAIMSLAAGEIFNGNSHGPASFMERGPQSDPPRPW